MTKVKLKGTIKLDTIKPHPNNPRIISEEKIKELGKSIKDFEDMMEVRGIVVDENNVIIGGNQRHAGLLAYGYTSIPGKWITKVTGWSEERKQEFMIKDNAPVSGEWDFEMLADWDEDKLEDWGIEVVGIVDFFVEQLNEEQSTMNIADYVGLKKASITYVFDTADALEILEITAKLTVSEKATMIYEMFINERNRRADTSRTEEKATIYKKG